MDLGSSSLNGAPHCACPLASRLTPSSSAPSSPKTQPTTLQAGTLQDGADASAVAAAVSAVLAAARPAEIDPRSGRLVQLIEGQRKKKTYLSLPRPSLSGSGNGSDAAAGGDSKSGSKSDSKGVGNVSPPPLVVHAVLDPLSKAAQQLAPLLAFLREALDAETALLLNPKVGGWVGVGVYWWGGYSCAVSSGGEGGAGC